MREKGDMAQYERWQKAGVKLPSFDKFKEIKYNENTDDYEALKAKYSDIKYTKNKLSRGEWGSKINPEKQEDHNFETRKDDKSYLAKGVSAQELFDKYAGTGAIGRTMSGKRNNVEWIVTDEEVGYDVNDKKGVRKTKEIAIHHSKKRTHISPVRRID
jgi:hypothetical protein